MADFNELLLSLQENDARDGFGELPSAAEFLELSTMFRAGKLAGGARLTPEQCQMLSKTFATLSVCEIKLVSQES